MEREIRGECNYINKKKKDFRNTPNIDIQLEKFINYESNV